MAFPSVAATATYTSGAGTTSTPPVNLPSGIASGDLLIVALVSYGSVTHTTPSGWTLLASEVWSDRASCFWRRADGTEGSTVTITVSGSVQQVGLAWRITGDDHGTSPEASHTSGDSSPGNPSTLDPGGWGTEDTLWLALTTCHGATAPTGAPTSFSGLISNASNVTAMAGASAGINTGSENPSAFTGGTTGVTWVAFTVGIRTAQSQSVTGVGAIASAEAFGTIVVLQSLSVTGVGAIASAGAFGTIVVLQSQSVTGVGAIASAEAFGTIHIAGGYAPPVWPAAYEYCVEFFTSGATFGPSTKIGELWDIRNLGWSRYDRMPGRGFFTLYQSSPLISSIVPLTTHVRITRLSSGGDVEVFNGTVSDHNSTGDDVLFDIYDYVSLLSLSRSGYRTMYPTVNIGTGVVSPQWALAKNATNSPLGFVATGTIEDPVGTDGTTPIKTNTQFGLMDQMRLSLFYDMAEMGRANTVNQATYEITRVSPFTFNFWKNKGTTVGVPLVLDGTVSDYQYAPNWRTLRNDLATLGTTVGGGATEVVKTDSSSAATYGLRQDVFTIKTLAGIGGSAVEADQQQAVAARMLRVATEGAPSLWVSLVPGIIIPFTGWDINDTMPVEIVNGRDSVTGAWRVLGTRAIIDDAGERLQILIGPVLT